MAICITAGTRPGGAQDIVLGIGVANVVRCPIVI